MHQNITLSEPNGHVQDIGNHERTESKLVERHVPAHVHEQPQDPKEYSTHFQCF